MVNKFKLEKIIVPIFFLNLLKFRFRKSDKDKIEKEKK